MFIEEKLSQARQKKQGIGKKSYYSNTSDGFEYKKIAQVNCLLKCSLKEKLEQERPILTEWVWLLRRR